ncbi:MAG TPA: ATP-binding protein [Stellaceae bacterium]|nr:ATP-binding protein [Stellaceae bacterium]
MAVLFVAASVAITFLIEALTGKFSTFPFYAAVVASAWFGTGSGCIAVVLSIIAVEDIWTPPLFDLRMDIDELPSFGAFVFCTLMSFAWSWQRRRAHFALEAVVEQRTADLTRTNAALQVEIAERETAEAELRRSETLLAQGQKLSRTASWSLKLPEREMRWSAQLFAILGFDTDARLASYQRFTERMHPDDRRRFEAASNRAVAENSDFACEARLVMPGGGIKHVQAIGEIKSTPDHSVEIIGTIVDLTERKRTEQALHDTEAELAQTLRLATVAELAATIAHEINQPLAAITANGSACLRSLAHEPPMLDTARDAAGCIVSDGHRAADVIARLRALFNKEQPKQRLANVNDIIQHVIEVTQGAIDRQRVVARVEFAAPPPLVMGDAVQLQQVLVNLVTNAIEAMQDITDRPQLLKIRAEVGQASVTVTVEDTGKGLAPEQVARVFDSFYTTKPDGIGVGLAISRSIIEAHGGTLWADPAMNSGAKFGFVLPLTAKGDGQDAKREQTRSSKPKRPDNAPYR